MGVKATPTESADFVTMRYVMHVECGFVEMDGEKDGSGVVFVQLVMHDKESRASPEPVKAPSSIELILFVKSRCYAAISSGWRLMRRCIAEWRARWTRFRWRKSWCDPRAWKGTGFKGEGRTGELTCNVMLCVEHAAT